MEWVIYSVNFFSINQKYIWKNCFVKCYLTPKKRHSPSWDCHIYYLISSSISLSLFFSIDDDLPWCYPFPLVAFSPYSLPLSMIFDFSWNYIKNISNLNISISKFIYIYIYKRKVHGKIKNIYIAILTNGHFLIY